MNEFEQFLVDQYGLKAGDEIDDATYEKASAEFRQAKSTVPSITPPAGAFNPLTQLSESQPTAQPQQTVAEEDETFGGLLPEQTNVLKGYWLMNKQAEDLIRDTGTRDQDKAFLRTQKQSAIATEWDPLFQQVGLNTADVEYKLDSIKAIQQKNPEMGLDEAIATVSGANRKGVSQDVSAKVKELQGLISGELSTMDGVDETQRARKMERIARWEGQIDTLSGATEMAPWDRSQEIKTTMEKMQKVAELGQGTVNYRGVNYEPAEFASLEPVLQREKANAWMEANENPGSLRVSLTRASVDDKGNPIKDQNVRNARYADLRAKLQPGEWYQDLDGSVKEFGGLETEEERGGDGYWTPDFIEPALAGSGVVAERVAAGAARLVPNIANTAGRAVSVLDRVTGGPQTRNVMSKIPTALRGGSPSVMLAQQGLQYLSAIGLKKQEADKKKQLAGQ